MPSTYSPTVKVELIATGEKSGTWGQVTNTNLSLLDQTLTWAYPVFTTDADINFLLSDGLATAGNPRGSTMWVGSSVPLTTTRYINLSPVARTYLVANKTSGGQAIGVKIGANTAIIGNNQVRMLSTDGNSFIDGITEMQSGLTISGSLAMPSVVGGPTLISGAWVYDYVAPSYASVVQLVGVSGANGIARMGGARSGRILHLQNVSGIPVSLYDEDTGAPAADRFYFGYPSTTQIIYPMESITLFSWDRWRMIGRSTTVIDGGIF